ncbi:hypothetical protein [Paenibacillus donghaensis]|uniref:Uncharacterized protein n=1 Tax=Paenibacillus donghaensis TaxID=414771 RepID=A0A2Z2K6C3_9BACL|nr:hypothetical protein [Paenibacillus donghaensis]ASA21746.1 hypothetical protein B9T62_13790 [Paenibacillus donghaensis]
MEQAEQHIRDWLQSHLNATIIIEKQELEDLDKVYFHLKGIDYREAADVLDEYLDNALILQGSGSTLNADGEQVPLPQTNYELAVSGLLIESLQLNTVKLTTERAKYVLSVEQSG